jgi:hypothetical protein
MYDAKKPTGPQRDLKPEASEALADAGQVQLKARLRGLDLDAQMKTLEPNSGVVHEERDGAVQTRAAGSSTAGSDAVSVAQDGVSGSGSALPHQAAIQASFGHHDVSHVQAHQGSQAQEAATAIGASAYATGADVAFAGSPDLHTAAHEAAHVIQQQGGGSLKGGMGEAGDVYERHADAVADQVVAGESAEGLLDTRAAGTGGAGGVQCAPSENARKPELESNLRVDDPGIDQGLHRVATIYFPHNSTRLDSEDTGVIFDYSGVIGHVLFGLKSEIAKATFLCHGYDTHGESDLSQERAEVVRNRLEERFRGKADWIREDTKNMAGDYGGDRLTYQAAGFGVKPGTGAGRPGTSSGHVEIHAMLVSGDAGVAAERELAEASLPVMLQGAITELGARGESRAQSLLKRVRDGAETLYFPVVNAHKYVHDEIGHRFSPSEAANDVTNVLLDAIRHSGPDMNAFCEAVLELDQKVFTAINYIWRMYQLKGETYHSAKLLGEWVAERQQGDVHSILNAYV